MTVGFFVGRFQPFHKGHLRALEHVLSRSDKVVIGVGSSWEANTPENPFSFDERRRMIESALAKSAGKFVVYGIPDFNDDVKWIKHIRENLPSFDIVYTNAGREASIFSGNRFKIEEMPFFERKKYSATEVRKRMLSGGNWRELVPKPAAEVIEKAGGVQRVKKLARN